MKHVFYFLFLALFYPVKAQFDYRSVEPGILRGVSVHAAQLLQRGGYNQMAIVGEQAGRGVLYLLNCADWSLADSVSVANARFLCVSESKNGLLYIGGDRTGAKRSLNGVLWNFQPRTRRIETVALPRPLPSLSKMVWLDRQGLVFGKLPNHSLAVVSLPATSQSVQLLSPIGNGRIENITAIAPLASRYDEIWLTGPASKSSKRTTWLMKINESGQTTGTGLIELGSDQYPQKAVAAVTDEDDRLVVAGYDEEKSPDGDSWMMRPSLHYPEKNENATPFVLDGFGIDSISALVRTGCHSILALRQGFSPKDKKERHRSPTLAFHSIQGDVIQHSPVFEIPLERRFQPVAFIRHEINPSVYYVAGSDTDLRGEDAQCRILILTEQCAKGKSAGLPSSASPAPAGKGMADASFSPSAGPRLVQRNVALSPQGVLPAKGEISVLFSLTNESEDMQGPGEVTVTHLDLREGITLDPACHKIPFRMLKKGASTPTLSINLLANAQTQAGVSRFIISVRYQNSEILSFPSPDIETTRSGDALTLRWVTPSTRTKEGSVSGTVELRSDKPTPPSQRITISDGSQKMERHKAQPVFKNYHMEGSVHVYTYSVELPLDTGKHAFTAYLEDNDNIRTEQAWVVEHIPASPNLYIISIGVPGNGLEFSDDDAADFAASVQNMAGGPLFNEVKYVRIYNDSTNTTRDRINGAVNSLPTVAAEIRPEDYLFFCISSHGVIRNVGVEERFCIVPHSDNATRKSSGDKNAQDYDDGLYYYYNLTEMLRSIRCKRFVFLDACHSGWGKGLFDPDLIAKTNLIAPGMVCFASSSARQLSYEYKKGRNGVFMEAVLEAIRGNPVTSKVDKSILRPDADSSGTVTIGELEAFLAKRVPDLLKDTEYANMQQTPVCLRGKEERLPDETVVFTKKQ